MLSEADLSAVWEMIESGRLAEAESQCHKLLAGCPELIGADFAMGVIAFRKGDKPAALAHLESYLQLAPADVAALGLAAQLLLEAGLHERALELGQRAYDLRPDEGPMLLLHLTGKARLASNQHLSALKVFEELIKLDPGQTAGYLGAADAFQALGSSFDAADLYRKASELAPNKAVLLKLSILELKLGRPSLALVAAQKILVHEPSEPRANTLAGQSLIEQNKLDEAQPYWERAEANSPEASSLNLKRGSSLGMMGYFEEGETYLRRSIALEPQQGSAYRMIFANRKAKESDLDLVRQMEELLPDHQIAAPERAALAFALGKAWDDLDDPEKAFRFYDFGHRIQMDLLPAPFDSARLDEQIRAQQLLFSTPPQPIEDGKPQPIFVIGMLRSGTTLTEQILSAHSHVVGAGEIDFWAGSEALMIDRSKPLFLPEIGNERRAAYRRILDSFGRDSFRVVDKFPGNLNLIGVIHHLFPEAHIVNLRRNPADIAVSLWATHSNPFSPFTVTRGGVVHAIRKSVEQSNYWYSVIPSDRFMDLKYEDLVSDPEKWIPAILDFCQLPWEEACLRASETKKKVRTPSLWQVRQPVYTTSVDRWKRYQPWLGEFSALL